MPIRMDTSKLERTLYKVEDGIATVTLNRPERMNALDTGMHKELYQIWKDVKYNDDAQVIIITGAGERGFCTGADMKEAAEARAAGGQLERWTTGDREGLSGTPYEHEIWKPMICAVNGTTAGGGLHFIWMSDFAICVPEATFLEPHVSVGQVPVREMLGMSRRIPLSYVLRMAFLGTKERIEAEKAMQLGIVTEIVPRDQLIPRARDLAKAIMTNNMASVRATKEILHRSLDLTLRDSIMFGFNVGKGGDRTATAEGAMAFAERRKADFNN